jgi:hypothetical protein
MPPADAARLAKVKSGHDLRRHLRGSLRALHVGGGLLRMEPTNFRHWLEGA